MLGYHLYKEPLEARLSKYYEELLRFLLERRDDMSEMSYRLKLWTFDNVTMMAIGVLTRDILSNPLTKSSIDPRVSDLAREMYDHIKANNTPPELHKRNVHFNNMHEMQSLVPLFNESNQRKFVAARHYLQNIGI